MNTMEKIRRIIRETGRQSTAPIGQPAPALVFTMLGIPAYECCPNYGSQQRQVFLPEKIA